MHTQVCLHPIEDSPTSSRKLSSCLHSPRPTLHVTSKVSLIKEWFHHFHKNYTAVIYCIMTKFFFGISKPSVVYLNNLYLPLGVNLPLGNPLHHGPNHRPAHCFLMPYVTLHMDVEPLTSMASNSSAIDQS